MDKANVLATIKQCFKNILPQQDARTKISPINFVIGLVFHFHGDADIISLESIRRFMIHHLGIKISKSSFWERLSRKRLKNLLLQLISHLMANIAGTALIGENILSALSVTNIYIVDSTSITLWDGAKDDYPGTRTNAGIKWHFCFDLFSGCLKWFEFSPTSKNDRKCFPPLNLLAEALIIFDLGYWDYTLLASIKDMGGFFLSRVKTNSTIIISEVVSGISVLHKGKKLSSLSFKRRGAEVVELIGSILIEGTEHHFRLIGFWNAEEKKYHWYITNLKIPASLMYSLYRLRWQVELVFKGHKNSLNADQIPSNNDNVIQSLLLASTVAHIASSVLLNIEMKDLNEEQKRAFSYQRLFKTLGLLASDFIKFLLSKTRNNIQKFIKKIELLSSELFDPNYKKRKTTLGKFMEELEEACSELNEKCNILIFKRRGRRNQEIIKKAA